MCIKQCWKRFSADPTWVQASLRVGAGQAYCLSSASTMAGSAKKELECYGKRRLLLPGRGPILYPAPTMWSQEIQDR